MPLHALRIIKEEFESTVLKSPERQEMTGEVFNNILRTLRNNIECRIEAECLAPSALPPCSACGVDHDPYLLCEDVAAAEEPSTPDAEPTEEDGYCPGQACDLRDLPF